MPKRKRTRKRTRMMKWEVTCNGRKISSHFTKGHAQMAATHWMRFGKKNVRIRKAK